MAPTPAIVPMRTPRINHFGCRTPRQANTMIWSWHPPRGSKEDRHGFEQLTWSSHRVHQSRSGTLQGSAVRCSSRPMPPAGSVGLQVETSFTAPVGRRHAASDESPNRPLIDAEITCSFNEGRNRPGELRLRRRREAQKDLSKKVAASSGDLLELFVTPRRDDEVDRTPIRAATSARDHSFLDQAVAQGSGRRWGDSERSCEVCWPLTISRGEQSKPPILLK